MIWLASRKQNNQKITLSINLRFNSKVVRSKQTKKIIYMITNYSWMEIKRINSSTQRVRSKNYLSEQVINIPNSSVIKTKRINNSTQHPCNTKIIWSPNKPKTSLRSWLKNQAIWITKIWCINFIVNKFSQQSSSLRIINY